MGIFDALREWRSKTVVVRDAGERTVVLDLRTETVYKSQPSVRAVVSFIADNIAGLPVKVYRREPDDSRVRVRDSAAALLMARPNGDQTTFEFTRQLVGDMLLYDRALVTVLRDDSPSGWQMRTIPPLWLDGYVGTSPFAPESYIIQPPDGAGRFELPASKAVLFHGYRPGDPMRGSSPIEALKDTLQEQVESDRYRLSVWRNGGRTSGYITRPKDVEPWSPESADRFRKQFREAWTGGGGDGGGVIVLEDGMELRQSEFNAKDAQWAEAKQLTRQEVAAQYHVKPALIWDEGQTYASVKENARSLYAESLAPRLAELEQRINAFLLPMIGAGAGEYVEFDLTGKLRGSFEEQASIFQSACGGPWMSRNEARTMNNLPRVEGGDELITPLNVITGGLASPNDTDPTVSRYEGPAQSKSAGIQLKGRSDEKADAELADAVRDFLDHQAACVLPRIGAKSASWWDSERWDSELAAKLLPLITAQSDAKGKESAAELGGSYEPKLTAAYLKALARKRAEAVNARTLKALQAAIDGGEPPREAFENEKAKADSPARSIAMAVAAFAVSEAVKQCRPQGQVWKTWEVNSDDPRASHAALDGETVLYSQPFSNGAMRPGDISLDAAEAVNCKCSISIYVED